MRCRYIVDNSSMTTGCRIYGTQLSGCLHSGYHENIYCKAGQRVDPNRNSSFTWRAKSTDGSSETLSPTSYTNWTGIRRNPITIRMHSRAFSSGADFRTRGMMTLDVAMCIVLSANLTYRHENSVVDVTCRYCSIDIFFRYLLTS